jgi:L-ascorbate metabolism protein UlaG (beta-lactamase superfamily)
MDEFDALLLNRHGQAIRFIATLALLILSVFIPACNSADRAAASTASAVPGHPPLTPAEIGPLDVILITHAHMDHLDIPSLKTLPKNATLIVCDKCAALIRPLGFNDVRELKWGESTKVKGLTVTAMPANHWGKRWPPFGADYGFNSYVLDRDNHRMLLACDSAYTYAFAALESHPPEVAAFSIGAYNPWIHNHANPEQVWSMFQQSGARYLVPIHWGTFRLSREPMDEPVSRLLKDAGDRSNSIVLRHIGASWTLPADSASAPRRVVASQNLIRTNSLVVSKAWR